MVVLSKNLKLRLSVKSGCQNILLITLWLVLQHFNYVLFIQNFETFKNLWSNFVFLNKFLHKLYKIIFRWGLWDYHIVFQFCPLLLIRFQIFGEVLLKYSQIRLNIIFDFSFDLLMHVKNVVFKFKSIFLQLLNFKKMI